MSEIILLCFSPLIHLLRQASIFFYTHFVKLCMLHIFLSYLYSAYIHPREEHLYYLLFCLFTKSLFQIYFHTYLLPNIRLLYRHSMITNETLQKVSSPQELKSHQEQDYIIQPTQSGVKVESCSSSFKPLLSDVGDHQIHHDRPQGQTGHFRINKSKSQNGSSSPISMNNQNSKQAESLFEKSLQVHQQANYRDTGITSRQQLISIPQTSNGESLVFRSAQTIILDDQKCQKREPNKDDQPKEQQQQKLIKQQATFNHIQPLSSTQELRTNKYEILMGSSSFRQQNQVIINNQPKLFVQTNTQQIKLDLKKEEENKKQEGIIVASTLEQLVVSPRKFKIFKHVQVTIEPYKSQLTLLEMPKEQLKAEETKKQIKIEVPSEPLKIQNLFISSLRSKSQIKPPQSTTQKKLKPWERKKKVESKPSQQQTDQSMKLPQIPNTLNSINSNDSLIDSISYIQTLNNKSKEKPVSQISVMEQTSKSNNNSSQLTKDTNIFTNQLKSSLFNENEDQFLGKIKSNPVEQKFSNDNGQNKLKGVNQSLKQTQDKPISFHHSEHHPLQKQLELIENSNGLKTSNIMDEEIKEAQENKPIQFLNKVQQQPIYQQKEQPQAQNQKGPEDPALNIKQQSDSCSSSSKNEIDINYSHNKKYQQQLHFLNRQRIKQLQQQLKTQQRINKQLENSIALPIKMAISTIAGVGVAGLAWILKKNRVGSLVLGVATTMATFVISN